MKRIIYENLLDSRISVGLPLAPEQQRVLGRLLLRTLAAARLVLVHVNLNLLDLESQDDGPYETQDHSRVSIHNILRSNVLQSHLETSILASIILTINLRNLCVKKRQTLVHILNTMNSHLPAVWFTKLLTCINTNFEVSVNKINYIIYQK